MERVLIIKENGKVIKRRHFDDEFWNEEVIKERCKKEGLEVEIRKVN